MIMTIIKKNCCELISNFEYIVETCVKHDAENIKDKRARGVKFQIMSVLHDVYQYTAR